MSSATPSEPVSYAKSRAAGPDGKGQAPEGPPTMGTEGPRRVTSRVGRERPRSARARATVAGQQHGLLPYPEYKPSGVERPAEVPEHWDVRRLKYLVSINDDVLPESTDPDFTIQYVDISNVDHSRGIHSFDTTTFGAAPSRARRIVRHGDTIVSTVRTYLRAIASIRRPAPNMIVSTGFAVLRPRSSLFSSGFAYHALGAPGFIDHVVAQSVGANYPAISANQIGSIPIAVPPVSQQHAIAGYLDRETAKIDALIRQKEALVKRLDEHRVTLVSRTVTRGLPPAEARKAGLDPHPKLKPSGVEWLGEMPEHWEVRRLKFVARRSIKNGLGEAAIHDDPDWPRYIRITDIASSRKLHGGTFKSLPPALAAKATVEAHDILFAAVGATYGKSYYHASHEAPVACFAGYLVRFSPDVDQVAPAFVAYWAESHAYWALIRSRVVQATIENFSAFKYKNLCVPVPPPHEQHAIASYLDRETTKIDRVAELARQEIHLLREYRTRLISDVVAGKVDVRGIAGTDMETAA